MTSEVGLHIKTFPTFVTCEGVHACVGSLMYSEVRFHTERLLPFTAFIGFLFLCKFSDVCLRLTWSDSPYLSHSYGFSPGCILWC